MEAVKLTPGKNAIFKLIGLASLSALGGAFLSKKAANFLFDRSAYAIMTQKFDKNIWEAVNSIRRMDINEFVETELRAHTKKFLERPLGGPRSFKFLDAVMFNMCQTASLPTPKKVPVDTSVIIGPKATRPLALKIPILIGGMAYGLALSEAYKIAFARAATKVGTATNTGLGPYLQSERDAAENLILQYPRASWNKKEDIIRQADAVEIQFGQGANAGIGRVMESNLIKPLLRKRLGLQKNQEAVIQNRFEEAETLQRLTQLVTNLRQETGGVPIGAKIGAGKYLEDDLDFLVKAGVDFIAVDGAEAGTHNSLPILQEDFGLPTFPAVCRAVKFFEKHRLKEKVSLIVGGGLASPGDILKILALGADAVYLGTVVLLAATHTQVLKVAPFEPPTVLAYETGRKMKKFNINEGTKSLTNFFNATTHELIDGVRALGKTATRDVDKGDIFALDRETAEMAGLDFGCFELRREK